jgi:hypothetical protein
MHLYESENTSNKENQLKKLRANFRISVVGTDAFSHVRIAVLAVSDRMETGHFEEASVKQPSAMKCIK